MYVHIRGKLLAAVKKVTVYNIELCSDHRGHRVLVRIFTRQVQSVFEGPQDLIGAMEQGVAGVRGAMKYAQQIQGRARGVGHICYLPIFEENISLS